MHEYVFKRLLTRHDIDDAVTSKVFDERVHRAGDRYGQGGGLPGEFCLRHMLRIAPHGMLVAVSFAFFDIDERHRVIHVAATPAFQTSTPRVRHGRHE